MNEEKDFFVALILFIVFLNSMILIVSIVIIKDKMSAACDKYAAVCYFHRQTILSPDSMFL